ncbi:MAG: Gfo/Idh/MocA family protein [Sedimentisphaerales bacterium]
MKSRKLRVACIGAGCSGVGQMLLLEKFEPGCCVAFCDLNRDLFDQIVDDYLGSKTSGAAGDFKSEYIDLKAGFRDMPFYTDVDEMFTKEDIDAAIIATYCKSHAEMVEKCVKYGVNILLEKPIAITEEDVEKVWRLLKDYPKVATVNFTMRGAPVTLAAARHVRNGDIGDVVSVQYVNNVHYGDSYFRRWMRTKENIGDLFLQKATHDLDIINSIIGLKPVSVAAFGSRLVYGGDKPNDLTCDTCREKMSCPMSIYKLFMEAAKPLPPAHLRKCVYAKEIDIDDNQVIIIQYKGGVTASYSQSFNAPMRGSRRGGQFIGTSGIMELQYYGEFIEDCRCNIIVGNSRIDIFKYSATPGTKISEVYDWASHGHFDGDEYGMRAKLDLVYGRSTEVKNTIEEGYISAKMCLAAQKSIETGKVINLDLIP